MIVLVDYGLGNIQAFHKIYKQLNYDVVLADTSEKLLQANKIILPGVGAFDWAMKRLNESGMRDTLDEMVLENNVSVLGVCVGMQMMANGSEEGNSPGLGWIDADVTKLNSPQTNCDFRLPHMGWNDINVKHQHHLFTDIISPQYYFLHSYQIVPKNNDEVAATASYGSEFTASIHSKNIFGTQFHPEKSHSWGVSLLKNFVEM